MSHPLPSREAIGRMQGYSPEDLVRMRGMSVEDPELRVVNRAYFDRIMLEREQALEKVEQLEEQCQELQESRRLEMMRAAGWPLATLLSAVCTYFLAR